LVVPVAPVALVLVTTMVVVVVVVVGMLPAHSPSFLEPTTPWLLTMGTSLSIPPLLEKVVLVAQA
jgi:hypothetical protein